MYFDYFSASHLELKRNLFSKQAATSLKYSSTRRDEILICNCWCDIQDLSWPPAIYQMSHLEISPDICKEPERSYPIKYYGYDYKVTPIVCRLYHFVDLGLMWQILWLTHSIKCSTGHNGMLILIFQNWTLA